MSKRILVLLVAGLAGLVLSSVAWAQEVPTRTASQVNYNEPLFAWPLFAAFPHFNHPVCVGEVITNKPFVHAPLQNYALGSASRPSTTRRSSQSPRSYPLPTRSVFPPPGNC